MSGFTYEELDDIDSAIGDSIYTMNQSGRHGTLDEESNEYLARLESLREKVCEMMEALSRDTSIGAP